MRIHFVGIGGIGVSSLAKYYLANGHKVSGSDLASSEITAVLKKAGAKIFVGKHKTKNIPKNVNLVIYSPAVREDNLELKAAFKIQNSKLKIKIQSYPQALGELTKNYFTNYFTIAICGSHGKSTVTAMLGLILTKAGFSPTVIVGTKVREFGDSNFRMGKGPYLVVEADEHFSSFLNYWPKIVVLTNLEADHLDYYRNFKNYILAFKKFISHLPKDGILVANKDDRNVLRMLKSKIQPKTQSYSLKQREAKKLRKILKIPGEFNISNALAALTVARILKIPEKISFETLSKYKGSWRRFEEKETTIGNRKLKIISDYAHHPTQIQVTLKAAREKYPNRKIWCVFQPHQYQRTYCLFDDFVNVFSKSKVDKLIITDIYDVAGREDKAIKRKVSSKKLVDKIKNQKSKIPDYVEDSRQSRNKNSIMHIPTIQEVGEYLKKNLRGREVVIIMGAGDIYRLSKKMENWQSG